MTKANNDTPKQLFLLGKNDRFIKDETGELLVYIPHDWSDAAGHGAYHPLQSQRYVSWLTHRIQRVNPDGLVKRADVKLAIFNLQAYRDGFCPPEKLFTRFGHKDGAVYLNLGGGSGKFVAITRDGWAVSAQGCPVAFTGDRTLEAIPEPVRGGSLAPLEALLPAVGQAFMLLIGWLLIVLSGQGPYPVLSILGPHGSAKTTLTRLLRRLIDPVAWPFTDMPTSISDLNVVAHNNAILCINNASKLRPEVSDALCRIATEGGSVKRKLRTDTEAVALDNFRPVMLNGITRLALRPDLQDRSIQIELPDIPPQDRRYLQDVEADFEACRPAVLGALLDGLVMALRNRETVLLPEKPRMADFVRLVTAAEPAFGWSPGAFLTAFNENQRDSALEAAMDSPVTMAIIHFMSNRKQPWSGTATALKAKLTAGEHGRLPATVAGLGRELRRIAPQLKHFGIQLDETRSAGQRTLTLTPSHTSQH